MMSGISTRPQDRLIQSMDLAVLQLCNIPSASVSIALKWEQGLLFHWFMLWLRAMVLILKGMSKHRSLGSMPRISDSIVLG